MSDAALEEKRKQVAKAYDSINWQEKVKKMSDAQIFALHRKFQEQHKI